MFNPEAPPAWSVTRWFNTNGALSLESLKGKVVVMTAFQMLCPGCVSHGLPQARRIAERYAREQVAVVGLHTVFEHHAVMTPEALEAFLKEYRWPFPVGIDEPSAKGGLPRTMAAYEMQGTPTLLLFDRQGRLRRHYLGQVDDMRVAAEIMALAIEDAKAPREQSVAIERVLANTLIEPDADDHHHHGHDHHGHDHAHGDACGCGHDHHHSHEHGHPHGHGHDHAPAAGRR